MLKVAVCVSVAAAAAWGQSLIVSTPRASQRAVAVQRIGLTDITVTYHRPAVNGRKVFGELVPWGQVWRAGANENTTIEFSDPVTVEGQPLAKGVYGLHMIPAADSWTIIFSKVSTAWGSFSYDKAEDALRVTVKPQTAPMQEALAYTFEDVKPYSAAATLRWDTVAVPFQIAVSKEVALDHVRARLRGDAQYNWQGWDEAAQYTLTEKIGLEDGLKWSDQSIQNEERFENVMTKAAILEALNRTTDAEATKAHALDIGTATQVYFYGRQLQTQKQKEQAIAVYRTVAKRFPQNWVGHMAQARVDTADGDYTGAINEIKAAEAGGAPEVQKPNMEHLIQRLQNKEDING